jgi:Na+/melibiose symporter-like transporter
MYKVNLGILSFLAALTSLLILPYILWNPKASSAIPWLVGILLLVLVLMIWAWFLFFRTKRILSEFPAEHTFFTPLEEE